LFGEPNGERPIIDEEDGFGDNPFDDEVGFAEIDTIAEGGALLDEKAGEEEGEHSRGPQAAGFDPSRQLPDVDDMAGAEGAHPSRGGSQAHALGTADPHAWSQRTAKMYSMLSAAFEESEDAPLSYFAMAKQTRHSANKRKVVAGCFQELLFLTTHGIIELDQRKAFSNILISKTENFDKAAAFPKAAAK